MNILFVCTGNTCRSPMAAYIAGQIRDRSFPGCDFHFDSAGLAASEGSPMSDNALAVLKERGIDGRKHRSRMLTEDIINRSDLVCCMTENHRNMLKSLYPGFESKLCTLGRVDDPYGGCLEIYRCTGEILDREIFNLLKSLSEE